jgi:hypothetical protein
MTGTDQPPLNKKAMLTAFSEGVDLFKRAEFSLDAREELKGQFCDVTVVFKPQGDVIFQLFPKKRKLLRGDQDGRVLLSELVEVYFSDTGRFSASWVPELESWALKAARLADTLSYDKDHHVYGFATYINQALADL